MRLWSPLLYDLVTCVPELLGLRLRRRRLLAGVRGPALEVGAGTGANLPFYPPGMRLVATEPEGAALRRAVGRHGAKDAPPEGVIADSMALPFRSESFNTVVATLVFCTVPDPVQGLREVRRVLRPTGALILLEHVRSRSRPLAWVQDRADPLWSRVAAGCHPNRDTLAAVRMAGFRPVSVRETGLGTVIEVHAVPDSRVGSGGLPAAQGSA